MDDNKAGARLCLSKAQTAHAQGDHAKATRLLQKALRLDPGVEVQVAAMRKKMSASSAAGPSSATSSSDARATAASRSTSRQASREPSAGPTKAEATNEQKKVVNEVKRLSKDYYKMLGVERDTPIDKIKKAYHRMARKCHPDKNPADGAEESFKALQTAYETLSDDQKRAAYDRFGADGPQMGGGGGNPFNFGGAGPQFRGGNVNGFHFGGGGNPDVEDIFRQFFQGGGNQRVFNMNTGGFQRTGNGFQRVDPRRRQHAQQQQRGQGDSESGNSWGYILQILPFVLLFFANIFLGGPSTPDYMLNRGGPYQSMQRTKRHDVAYYTQEGFIKGMSHNRRYKLEASVEHQWVQYLNDECDKERRVQKKDYDRYWWKRDEAGLQRTKNRKLKKCDEYKAFRNKMRS